MTLTSRAGHAEVHQLGLVVRRQLAAVDVERREALSVHPQAGLLGHPLRGPETAVLGC